MVKIPNQIGETNFYTHKITRGQKILTVAKQWAIKVALTLLLICFAPVYTAVMYNAFQWPRQPPENCPFPWGIWTPSNTWFLGPTQVIPPNVILISLAVMQH